jgi:hypothetical protein
MNIPEVTVASTPLPIITPKFLADTTLEVLSEEERLLPFGIRGFRECDVQFLLWRELALRGYEAETEEKRIDITIHDDRSMIAAIEVKGPWLAKTYRFPHSFADLCATDFKKHFYRIFALLPGQCYSLWIFTGKCEEKINGVFDKFLESASTAAPGCSVEWAGSQTLILKNPHPRWRVCKVYAIRVYKDNTEAAVV